ncbi:MAG: hypothetical protein DME45_06540 [Verrucomicrobia bacterium]|nr:MAG: hypothetical protein DME45_06540 [Verrucomicrobiota bacterium]
MAARIPLLIVTALLGAATLFTVVIRLSEALAISPWEPAIAMEAMRLNTGLPLYENAHATHMYGPLLTVFLAGIFRVAGLNLLAGRIGFSILAFALAFLLSAILCQSRTYRFISFILFLAINLRTNLIFLSAQPDGAAALFGVAGLYLWATRSNLWQRSVYSIAFFLCATLFKQTGAAFALVPIVYSLIWKRRLGDVAISLVPAMSIVLMLAVIRLIWPQTFFGIVTVPASITVNYNQALPIGAYLIATFPIFGIALLARVFSQEVMDVRERWILSAIIVLVPLSVWTTCKSGGGYSSLMFGYLALTAFFVLKLDAIWQWIGSLRGWRTIVSAIVLAAAILFSFLIQFRWDLALLLLRAGDEKYATAVITARRAADRVISPQDPTIAYRASGYFGRSLFFELDTHPVNGGWPSEIPESLRQELAQARYVMAVSSYVPTPMFEDALVKNHFQPMDVADLRGSSYTLWRKGAE